MVLGVLFFGMDSAFAESKYIYIDPLPEWADYASSVMYLSTTAWEDANENLNFYVVENWEDADFRVQWVKEFGVEHVGYAYGNQFIEVGLGDSNCGNQWNPYSEGYISHIMKHEIGHIFGHEHNDDPDSIMYPVALNLEYGIVEEEYRLTAGYGQFVPFCTIKDFTSYEFSITTNDETYGFDYYVVPSSSEFDKWGNGEAFQHYSNDGCFGEGWLTATGTCEGVSKNGGIMILVDDQLTSPLVTIIVKQLEKSPSNNIQHPLVSKSHTNTTVDDYEGYGSWDEYCKATYGSEYYYDVSDNNCYADSQIYDNVAPTIATPTAMVVDADDQHGAIVDYHVMAIDDIDGEVLVLCTPSASSYFPIGKTTVFCNAEDSSGNQRKSSFTITVSPSQPDSSVCGTGTVMKDGKCVVKPAESISKQVSTEATTSTTVKTCDQGTELVNGICQVVKTEDKGKDGGCLIATATYGSELAPQVQQLRELRDNSLLQTASGTSFMSSFNDFYYSFSPTIADWERESPIFKEAVKITLTPMISSLSILNYVDMDSEVNVLGYGISLILLNIGMYFVAPAIVIVGIRKNSKIIKLEFI